MSQMYAIAYIAIVIGNHKYQIILHHSLYFYPGLLSMWVSSRRPFPYTSHQSKEIFDLKHWRPQQNCWRRHSPIYKHGLSDWDVLLKGWSRVEECGWTGWGERVCHQLVKQTLVAHITFRWLLLYSEMVQFISVVGVTLCGRDFSNFWRLRISIVVPLKAMFPSGVNEDVALGWCLFCVGGVKWQPCWVE